MQEYMQSLTLQIAIVFRPDLIDLFSDAFAPRGQKLNGKQRKFSGKNHHIEPPLTETRNFLSYHFHINFIIDLWLRF